MILISCLCTLSLKVPTFALLDLVYFDFNILRRVLIKCGLVKWMHVQYICFTWLYNVSSPKVVCLIKCQCILYTLAFYLGNPYLVLILMFMTYELTKCK